MIDLIALLAAQRDLQVKFGYDYVNMTDQQRIDYIKENVLACTDELHEALKEVGWKSWATSCHINNDAFFGELRDAWQFLINLMLIVEPDPVKLAKLFADSLLHKHSINTRRIEQSYDGVSTKCAHCGRALDEISIIEIHLDDTIKFKCECGNYIDNDIIELLI